ncbi:UDP-N-acetylmuramoyl-tripeptide--D-alanyl-D-alanine ligase [Candidatus Bipolaricaulota bacterium]|nr:UDP-N-acetylmuramoyl-tripeptide--D-alanyl-D-alanine ligase [Candidatus Bipolaricaulota bacterium]
MEKIAQIVEGELLRRESAIPGRAIHDSRLVQAGDVFVALSGLKSDGHRFLPDVFARGASAAIVSDVSNLPDNARNLILVDHPALALQQWSAAWRKSLNATIVAITGTNGKTTVRALLGHLLSAQGSVYVSPHNYNTEIGLPISLLSMPANTDIGVFELGAERPGDIAILAEILQPHIGILTSVGTGHLDGFKTVEAVASEKWSLIEHLPENGIAIINADVPRLLDLAATANVPVVTTGLNVGDLQGQVLQTIPSLKIQLADHDVTLACPLVGTHNANNLLLAAAAAHRLGISWHAITAQAASFKPIAHRLQPIPSSFGTILDDTYNANPASMMAALDVLASFGAVKSRRVFVFGTMSGLGTDSDRFHREIAQQALHHPIDTILPIGDAAISACRAVTMPAEKARVVVLPRDEIKPWVIAGGSDSMVVLVKGSRDLALENLVANLLSR